MSLPRCERIIARRGTVKPTHNCAKITTGVFPPPPVTIPEPIPEATFAELYPDAPIKKLNCPEVVQLLEDARRRLLAPDATLLAPLDINIELEPVTLPLFAVEISNEDAPVDMTLELPEANTMELVVLAWFPLPVATFIVLLAPDKFDELLDIKRDLIPLDVPVLPLPRITLREPEAVLVEPVVNTNTLLLLAVFVAPLDAINEFVPDTVLLLSLASNMELAPDTMFEPPVPI